jgi:hypothetical protein
MSFGRVGASPMAGLNQSTAFMRKLTEDTARAQRNTMGNPLDTPMTEPQRMLLAVTRSKEVGYNMVDVAKTPRITDRLVDIYV